MNHTAPKYSKIEISFKFSTIKELLNETPSLNETNLKVKTFEDCGVVITGNHLLIIEDNKTDGDPEIRYTKQTIFDLSEIESYKVYNV